MKRKVPSLSLVTWYMLNIRLLDILDFKLKDSISVFIKAVHKCLDLEQPVLAET